MQQLSKLYSKLSKSLYMVAGTQQMSFYTGWRARINYYHHGL